MSDSSADSLPTLGYATPDADGMPSFVPEAERMIDEGATPYHLRELFGKGRPAALYYAKSMARRYSPTSSADACLSCGRASPEMLAQTQWTVEVPVRSLEFQLSSDKNLIPCTLYLPMCNRCALAWWQRATRFAWLAWAGFLGRVVVPLLISLPNFFFPRFFGRMPAWATFAWVGGWVALMIVIGLANAVVRRHVIPKAVKNLANRRLKFAGLSEIIDGKDLAGVAEDENESGPRWRA